jgi:hypothetical protein
MGQPSLERGRAAALDSSSNNRLAASEAKSRARRQAAPASSGGCGLETLRLIGAFVLAGDTGIETVTSPV